MSFAELKERQSKMWDNGPFEVVAETIADVHETVVDRLDPQPGEHVLDIACGTGQLSERVARRGAAAVGVDFAPSLIDTARRRAAEFGLEIDYRVGDAEDLADFEDGAFDAVASTFGIMFAPDHAASSRELARVTRSGGRIALATWTTDGLIARMFALLAQFQPPPPPEAGRPLAWGDVQHVRSLLGDSFELRFEQAVTPVETPTAEAMWELFSTSFGPLKTIVDMSDDDRRDEVKRAFVDYSERESSSQDVVRHEREYLLVLGTRR